jgi:hypothetical protein
MRKIFGCVFGCGTHRFEISNAAKAPKYMPVRAIGFKIYLVPVAGLEPARLFKVPGF